MKPFIELEKVKTRKICYYVPPRIQTGIPVPVGIEVLDETNPSAKGEIITVSIPNGISYYHAVEVDALKKGVKLLRHECFFGNDSSDFFTDSDGKAYTVSLGGFGLDELRQENLTKVTCGLVCLHGDKRQEIIITNDSYQKLIGVLEEEGLLDKYSKPSTVFKEINPKEE